MAAESTDWYYVVEGLRVGPVSHHELAGALWQGAIPWATSVWTDGMPEWAEAKTVAVLTTTRVSVPAPGGAAAGGAGQGRQTRLSDSRDTGVEQDEPSAPSAKKSIAWWKKTLAVWIGWIVVDLGVVIAVANTVTDELTSARISQAMGSALVWGTALIWTIGYLGHRGDLTRPIPLGRRRTKVTSGGRKVD